MSLSRTLLFKDKLYQINLHAGVYGTYWEVRNDQGQVIREGRHGFRFLATIDSPNVPHQLLAEQVNSLLAAI